MVVEGFKEFLIYEKRYSSHTVEAYLNDIAQFSTFIESMGVEHFYAVLNSHVRLWVVQLVEEGRKSSSIHRKLSALKTLYKYSIRKGKTASNPAKGIQLPKIPHRLPKFVEQKSIEKLFEQQTTNLSDFVSYRDNVIIEILYSTGMRRQELIQLKWSDIDEALLQVKVFGKGSKERYVPISPSLVLYLKSYFEVCKREFGSLDSDSNVILTESGKKAYPQLIYRVVHRKLKEIDVKTQKSPHVLRHTFATHMSNKGAPLNDVKSLLGHASLASTQIYTHNTIEQLKEIFKQSHPKA